jgi:pimeloyl-ACP methyl ester carboxylesterase
MRRNLKHTATWYGDIAYTDKGVGPAALFVHGVFLNGYLWRHVIDRVADVRRCIAVDLLAHGATRTPRNQDVSFEAQALSRSIIPLGLPSLKLQLGSVTRRLSGTNHVAVPRG